MRFKGSEVLNISSPWNTVKQFWNGPVTKHLGWIVQEDSDIFPWRGQEFIALREELVGPPQKKEMKFKIGKIGYDLLIWYPNLIFQKLIWMIFGYFKTCTSEDSRGGSLPLKLFKRFCYRLLKAFPKQEFQKLFVMATFV